jgi:hypothetical protein
MAVITAEVFQNEYAKHFLGAVIIADFLDEKRGDRFRFGMNPKFVLPKTEPIQ